MDLAEVRRQVLTLLSDPRIRAVRKHMPMDVRLSKDHIVRVNTLASLAADIDDADTLDMYVGYGRRHADGSCADAQEPHSAPYGYWVRLDQCKNFRCMTNCRNAPRDLWDRWRYVAGLDSHLGRLADATRANVGPADLVAGWQAADALRDNFAAGGRPDSSWKRDDRFEFAAEVAQQARVAADLFVQEMVAGRRGFASAVAPGVPVDGPLRLLAIPRDSAAYLERTLANLFPSTTGPEMTVALVPDQLAAHLADTIDGAASGELAPAGCSPAEVMSLVESLSRSRATGVGDLTDARSACDEAGQWTQVAAAALR